MRELKMKDKIFMKSDLDEESNYIEDIELAEDLKYRINDLIWQYSPENLTLREAKNLSNEIFSMIEKGVV